MTNNKRNEPNQTTNQTNEANINSEKSHIKIAVSVNFVVENFKFSIFHKKHSEHDISKFTDK